MSSSDARAIIAHATPIIARSETSAPVRHAKMKRLGRQMSRLATAPALIFSGAASICLPPEKLPTTSPYAASANNAATMRHAAMRAERVCCRAATSDAGRFSRASTMDAGLLSGARGDGGLGFVGSLFGFMVCGVVK